MENVKKLFAEFSGTFVLVLLGTGAIIVNEEYPESVTHLGVSVTFGVAVTAMILLFGHVSGAHINPAVTLGFWITKHVKKTMATAYLIAQIFGALSASILLSVIFPSNQELGATLPKAGIWQSALIEFVMTFMLMLVILLFSQNSRVKKFTAWAVGATVGLEAYFGGPFTGASMNPARSIGPALISGEIEAIWIYIFCTTAGAVLASVVWTQNLNKSDS
jgi:aquaporin NIP